jgi:hypothetical protein
MARMQRLMGIAVIVLLTMGRAVPGRAESGLAGSPAPTQEALTPAGLLTSADAAIETGDLQRARALFEKLLAGFPATPEAREARRALRIMAARATPTSHASVASKTTTTPGGDIIVRDEPYSLKTSERLRLTIWEKVDFSVTSFLYGMSVGLSFALSQNAHGASDVLTPIALGAMVYTLGSIGFLKLTNPDRGDLPLALAITSYVPTTTLLLLSASDSHAKDTTVGAATAAAGVLSIPIAVIAARHLDLDPGDTQLVRDAGFWGLALSTVGMLGFGGTTSSSPYVGSNYYQAPSGRKVAVAGLLGLYGGLGLGLLGASVSEVSLERVRVTTWGGYGGAVVGLLLGAAANNGHEQDIYRGATLGALAGLLITFLSTGGLDGIPTESTADQAWHQRLAPMMVQVTDRDGRPHPGFGFGGAIF